MSFRIRILLAAGCCLALGRVASASDVPALPLYSSSPAALAGGGCATPAGSGVAGLTRYTAGCRGVPKCNTGDCDTTRFQGHRQKDPYVVNLCPGACFGYFPTQWRSWEEVCPTGVAIDPHKAVPPYVPPASDRPLPDMKLPDVKKNGDGVPAPRTVDPKTGMGATLPPPSVSVMPSSTGGVLPTIPAYPGLNSRY